MTKSVDLDMPPRGVKDGDTVELVMCNHRWISVKDRLPDKLVRVLVYVPSYKKYGQDQYVAAFCNWEESICNEWHVDSPSNVPEITATFNREEVTYWMTLPEPPNEI